MLVFWKLHVLDYGNFMKNSKWSLEISFIPMLVYRKSSKLNRILESVSERVFQVKPHAAV